ncbi:hypothetical protein AVEN_194825-1 [Araneus ventricosus]|uniref:Uncharacterized protein n=1 Tax=Araneus ventricosus TaxID=182803 RepID=A0A4Y2B307_ARAVE|nr:hypothetical protein AVEN_194825-1 [Araneus ventricosus]
MAATIITAMFWATNKLKRRQFQAISTETVELKTDASTQVDINQVCEKSTQTLELKSDVSTQIEQIQVDAKLTQTDKEIMHERDVQTLMETSESKGTQTSPPYSFLDKKVQTKIIPNSFKVLMPVKKQNPTSKIPLTSEFLNYLERKNVICKEEKHGNGTKFLKLPSHEQLEIQATNENKDITAGNSSKMCFLQSGQSGENDIHFLVEDVVTTANQPVPFHHEYAAGYIKLSESKEKQNGLSRFKKQFEKLKKMFKK